MSKLDAAFIIVTVSASYIAQAITETKPRCLFKGTIAKASGIGILTLIFPLHIEMERFLSGPKIHACASCAKFSNDDFLGSILLIAEAFRSKSISFSCIAIRKDYTRFF